MPCAVQRRLAEPSPVRPADEPELRARPDLALGYVTAPPQMAHYMDVSTKIYQIYLRHIAPEDIHVYSIDEVFIDATGYLAASGLTARELAMKHHFGGFK